MGKKSGPLAFLNKKGWHPGNLRNMEKVWKKEQEALAEQKQVDELRKQYDEARQKEEVEAMAVAAGVKKKQERLDWMYQGGMVAKQEADKRSEAQLLGEKDVELPPEGDASAAEQVAQLPSFYTTDTPASANEMWQRLHGDPMFAIKQQELMARKKIVANPVQMDSIRQAMAAKARAKAERKAAKAEQRAAKKAAKKMKKEKRKQNTHKKADATSGTDSSQSNHENGERPSKRMRESEPPLKGSQSLHKEQNGKAGYSARHAEHSNEHERRRSTSGHDLPQRSHYDSHRDREHHRGSRHRTDTKDSHPSREQQNGHSRHRSLQKEAEATRESDRLRAEPASGKVKVYHDAASAQNQGGKYGISLADGKMAEDREAHKRETERRLEEAARQREAEERQNAAQRYQRKEYKTGKLSEDEKARRLAEMSGNADVHEEARWARLQAARKKDDTEEATEAAAREKATAANAAPGRHHQDTARFLSQATKDVYGGNSASLADRVGRRKYYNDRSRDEDSRAFQR